MIVSVPSPPLLLPGITGRPVLEVELLRAACLSAITDLLASAPAEVVVVGAATPGWGPAGPLAGQVAQALLDDAEAANASNAQNPVKTRQIFIDRPDERTPAECLALGRGVAGQALLVVADGSARRGVKAPGYLDERAEPFDRAILAALQGGQPSALAELDPELASELMVAGRAAWQVMAGAAEGQDWVSRTYYADDPFGVFYPVVSWTERSAT